ncbi:hypothetical protein VNI00_015872 [Paramarasmius palmivorus]|uniref:Uncharacterized protein n=1 Tax=Paramarasmius palmivorus TaxID=297713 RepID=A0AAW0BI09_9AGAR
MSQFGDSNTLLCVQELLSRDVPGSSDAALTVVSACRDAVVALEAYTVFLYPYPLGPGGRETCFPNMSADQTWGLLQKWFLGLQLWSPCFAGTRDRPSVLCSSKWFNRVLRTIFDLVYVFAQQYPRSNVAGLLRDSREYRRLALQLTYGALTVDGVELSTAVGVLVHGFWKESACAAVDTVSVLNQVIQQHKTVDLLSAILKRVDLLLDSVPELHALAYLLLLLHQAHGEAARASRAVRWMAMCVYKVLKELDSFPIGSTMALRALDTVLVGRMLSLCFQFIREIAVGEGSGGWVLEGLHAGLLRAVMDIGVFVELEERRAEHVVCLQFSSVLKEDCDELLATLVPHLLTPAIRRVVQREMDDVALRVAPPLQSWLEWVDAVSLVVEEAAAFKASTYGEDCASRCFYEMCSGKKKDSGKRSTENKVRGKKKDSGKMSAENKVGCVEGVFGGSIARRFARWQIGGSVIAGTVRRGLKKLMLKWAYIRFYAWMKGSFVISFTDFFPCGSHSLNSFERH